MVKQGVIIVCKGIKRNGLVVTEEIIDQVVETFSSLNYKPPIVLGHINQYKDGDPAAGRVLALRKVEHNGKACISADLLIAPWIERSVESGEYDGFSVGIYVDPESGKYYLHHLALLGAVPPADQSAGLSAGEVKLSVKPEDLIILDFQGMKLSTCCEGGEKMDVKAIVTALVASEEFKKELAKAAQEAVKVTLSASQEKHQKEPNELERLYKEEKIGRIKEIALSAGMSEEGVKALETLCKLFKPVIELSSGEKLSPFDLLEKALREIKPPDKDLLKPITLSASEQKETDIFDPSIAKVFTVGGER